MTLWSDILSRDDRAAMQRAIDEIMSRSANDRVRIEEQSKVHTFEEVGVRAVWEAQSRNLGLGPHDEPPISSTPSGAAVAVKQQLIDAGLSVYEPHPQVALQNYQQAVESGMVIVPPPDEEM
jgi:hypothetical protein